MRQGFKKYSDMRQGFFFFKLTCNIAINKRQRHVTLAILKIDRRHGNPQSRAPVVIPDCPAGSIGIENCGRSLICTFDHIL